MASVARPRSLNKSQLPDVIASPLRLQRNYRKNDGKHTSPFSSSPFRKR